VLYPESDWGEVISHVVFFQFIMSKKPLQVFFGTSSGQNLQDLDPMGGGRLKPFC